MPDIRKLSPLERRVIPYLRESPEEIVKKSGLDKTSVLRALRFLEQKGFLKLEAREKTIVDMGTNGIYYKKKGLPERRLLLLLDEKNHVPIQEARKLARLTDNEFKVSLGALKGKALLNVSNGKLTLSSGKEEIVKKFPEEQLLERLPAAKDSLEPQELHALQNLLKRKDIVRLSERKQLSFSLTDKGKEIAGRKIASDYLEEVTPGMVQKGAKGKIFREYDVRAFVPKIYGGKEHFVNQSVAYAKHIWQDLGFKEMTGPMVETAFWNFDALFTAQDHPARDLQDTFYLDDTAGALPSRKVVKAVKESHEKGVGGSKGWQMPWDEEEAKKVVLRTHTTSLSARTLAMLKPEDLPAKFYAIGKVFRNETIDWSHGIEFYQTEGIVIDERATLRHLLGYLKMFYEKMGFKKIKFVPSYFPYTEPSVEVQVFHPEKKEWFELGGSGIFRPEVTIPLLGKPIPVLAWGQGFDRIIMDFYRIKDLREMYMNDVKQLREKEVWTR